MDTMATATYPRNATQAPRAARRDLPDAPDHGPAWSVHERSSPRIALSVRSTTGAIIRTNRAAAIDWPQRRFHPKRGWPIWIPPTTETAYLSGYTALNVPALPGEPRLGDWHEDDAWWSPTYLRGDGQPDIAQLWGPDGARPGAPAPPELRDARTALAQLEHPAGKDTTPVLAATVAQAILDLAWEGIRTRGGGPGRREIIGWTDDAEEERLRGLAVATEPSIDDPCLRAKWRAWQAQSLHGDDPFYAARPARADPCTRAPPVNLIIKAQTRRC